MARFLVEAIQERIVHIVLATSTLTDGVNLPFETILIPTLRRRTDNLNVQEFGNLVGRAGRPGFGTEGRSLVLMESEPASYRHDPEARRIRETRSKYNKLIQELADRNGTSDVVASARSPLTELLKYLEEQWQRISNTSDRGEFLKWLEQTAPINEKSDLDDEKESSFAIEALDSLDNILLSFIVEIEQLENTPVSEDELETRLQKLWQRSYAYFASEEETRLSELFIRRGQGLLTNIYPDASQRRRLYRTNLPPRSGNQLLNLYPLLVERLKMGEEYASWSQESRFEYIQSIVDLLKSLPHVGIKETLSIGKSVTLWNEILRWWLTSESAIKLPTDISLWHNFVSTNFVYRFNWGLGSVVSLALDKVNDGKLLEPSLENWPLTELPWIVLWLKELIVWGTLEPVAAYLLARGIEVTRTEAEETAHRYYNEFVSELPVSERLNAVHIRDWAATISKRKQSFSRNRPPTKLGVNLLRDFSTSKNTEWKVLPVEKDKNIYWFDPAGYPLAICKKPENWQAEYIDRFDFILSSLEGIVIPSSYI